jgi:hypothetical protein
VRTTWLTMRSFVPSSHAPPPHVLADALPLNDFVRVEQPPQLTRDPLAPIRPDGIKVRACGYDLLSGPVCPSRRCATVWHRMADRDALVSEARCAVLRVLTRMNLEHE